MSYITNLPHSDAKYTEEKDKAIKRFIALLKESGKGFWAYTEETGECDTSSFKGLL